MALSILQLRRLEKLLEKGDEGILEYMLEVEEKLEGMESPQRLTREEKREIAEMASDLIEVQPVRIRNGQDYVLTEKDKQEIAEKIKVPVVEKTTEKVIERVETPVYNTEVKEVAIYETASTIRNKLEGLRGDERLSADAIKDLDDKLEGLKRLIIDNQTRGGAGGSTARNLYQLGDVNVVGITTNQSIKWNGSQWVPYTASGGTGYTVETPTGSVNSSNVTFTVTTIPVYIVSDGITYFENAGFTRSSLTLTLDVPPSSYIRSFY